MEFKVGEKAVIPTMGVGVCKGLVRIEEDGEEAEGYSFDILETQSMQSTSYWVNRDHVAARGVRPVVDSSAIDRIYQILADKNTPPDRQTWNRRYREYSVKITGGDPMEVAAVLRDLAVLRSEKPLSFGEKRVFEQAHGLLAQEIAVARDVDLKTITDEFAALFTS